MAFIFYNPSPTGARVGDCAIRALSKALNVDWETAYLMACVNGMAMGDLPNSDSVWGSVLRQNGFMRKSIPNTCPDCYSIDEFCQDHPKGTYVVGTGNHVVTVVDGDYYDTWESGNEIPVYVWFKKD